MQWIAYDIGAKTTFGTEFDQWQKFYLWKDRYQKSTLCFHANCIYIMLYKLESCNGTWNFQKHQQEFVSVHCADCAFTVDSNVQTKVTKKYQLSLKWKTIIGLSKNFITNWKSYLFQSNAVRRRFALNHFALNVQSYFSFFVLWTDYSIDLATQTIR